MKKHTLDKYSWAFTTLTLIGGFLLMQFGYVDYGYTFFIIFPILLGFSVGLLFKKGIHILYLIIGLSLGCIALIMFGIEGFVCVLMLLPIFSLFLAAGYIIGSLFDNEPESNSNKLLVSALPLVVLLIGGNIELRTKLEPKTIEIVTSIDLPYEAELLFDGVKSMEKLDGKKPLLMKLGLPVPIRCVLDADEVGSLRHCIFKNGKITAKLTKYKRGESLEMEVVNYTLTGRHWFKFIDANYKLDRIDKMSTRITRTSSYKSILKPRWYWEPLEKVGIEQEHSFVLNSLKKNIEEKNDK